MPEQDFWFLKLCCVDTNKFFVPLVFCHQRYTIAVKPEPNPDKIVEM